MADQSRNHPRGPGLAKKLRREATPAERALWDVLRGGEGPRWRRQAPIGAYIVDFVCFEARVIVELDGGAHDDDILASRDHARQKWLESEDFTVLRFDNAQVLYDASAVADEARALVATRIAANLPPPSRGRAGVRVAVVRPVDSGAPPNSSRTTAPPPPAPAPRGGGGSTRADLVLVGAVAGAFGVRGEVRVRSFTAAPEGVVSYGPLYDAEGRLVMTPKRWREINDGLAVSAPEIKDRDAAEALKSTPLHVPRGMLPPAEEDEFYHIDLIGCRVETLAGEAVGEIIAVQDFGAGDLLEVRAGGKTLYFSFTREVVPHVDIAARRVVVAPPTDAEIVTE